MNGSSFVCDILIDPLRLFCKCDRGTVTEGHCGQCDGLAGVDTLGVMEFDTSTDSFIASHVMPDGTGGDPFGSPDGRHVVLVGRNGGEVLRILKAGEPGEPSVSTHTSELNCERCLNMSLLYIF